MGQTTTITITNAPDLTAEQLAELADGHVYDTTAWTDEGRHAPRAGQLEMDARRVGSQPS